MHGTNALLSIERWFAKNAVGAILLAMLLCYACIILYLDQHLAFDSLISILNRSIALAITAVGQTFVILVASIDLSVANLISVSAVLASFIMNGDTAMIVPAMLAVLAIGATVGVINGIVVARLQVNPLIATLGMSLILQGLLSASFQNFSGSVPESFQVLAYGKIAGLPFGVILLTGLVLLSWFVLKFTRIGSDIYSVGGNPDAARFAGIKTANIILKAHIISSLCATVAGLYLASRLRSGAPWIGRDGVYDLESIAVVVIGGTILSGGRGGIWGTMAGVLIFSLLDAIFNLLGVDAFLKQVLRGVLIVAAVAVYAVRSKEAVS